MIFRANGESSMINAATVTADSPRTSLPAVLLQGNYYSLRKLSMNRAHVGSASARSALRDLANEYPRRHASTHALADRADRSARLDGQNIAHLDRAGASGPKIQPECVSADRAIARTLHR